MTILHHAYLSHMKGPWLKQMSSCNQPDSSWLLNAMGFMMHSLKRKQFGFAASL